MLKWIINILILVGIYKLVKSLTGPKAPKAPEDTPKKPEELSEELVEDPQCGVYVPKSVAVKGPEGKLFCSEECAEKYRKKKEEG